MNPNILEELVPLVGTITFFAFLTTIILARFVYRGRERKMLMDLARLAIEKGQGLPPELISQLADASVSRRTAFSDLRAGVIWVAVGVGVALFGVLIGLIPGAEQAMKPIAGVGLIPALVGVALIVLSRFNPNKDKPREL